MKRKPIIILSIILTIILLILTTMYIKKKKKIEAIKNNYNPYVITKIDTNIYDNNHEVIGTIYQNTYLELEEPSTITTKDIYFQIKNTNYYILNTDIEKTEQNFKEQEKNYYVNLGKTITTNTPTNLYKENNLKITIKNTFTFDVLKSDDTYYYIEYLNQTYQIKKDEIAEIKDIEIDAISKYISVINYKKVEEKCSELECVTLETYKNELKTLKENGNYTITIDDYKKWLNNNINLKEKAILITSTQANINEIAKEFEMNVETNLEGLEFIDTNTKSEVGNTKIPRYTITTKTTDDIFKKIMNGENIIYIEEKPIVKAHTLPDINATASKIAVLNYHFFYDPELGETCPDGNCKTVQAFEQELNYLKKNDYKTLTMDEFTKWMYGEIELPARSVLITVDDGAMGTGTHNGNKLIPLLEKYNMHATLFLITGWWPIGNYSSPYLDIESHTFDMHEGNYCTGVQRGSKLLCSTKEQVTEDLKHSMEITGSNKAFCFPMYVYNETTRTVLKELNFKLAFIGGDTKATRNNDKYKVPRYHIYRETTLDQFINMIS